MPQRKSKAYREKQRIGPQYLIRDYEPAVCDTCHGQGVITKGGVENPTQTTCPDCDGSHQPYRVACAACRSPAEMCELDFHHWDYDDDVGCLLCRECHDYIHEPEGARPSEAAGGAWVWEAVPRLADLQQKVGAHPVEEEDVSPIEWYNIPEDFNAGLVNNPFQQR